MPICRPLVAHSGIRKPRKPSDVRLTKEGTKNYRKKCRIYQFRVNKETEGDVADWLDEGNTAARLKALIRQDIKNNPRK